MRHRDYLLLTVGLAVTLLGAGMSTVALFWQIIAMGGGPAQVSLVMTVCGLGLLATLLPAGVAADRLPRLWVMRVSLVAQAILLLVLGWLTVTDRVQIWHFGLAGLILGIAEGMYFPSYTALLPSLLPAEDLLSANGTGGVLRPGLQLAAGPALGAFVVKLWSTGSAFLTQGVLMVVAVLMLSLMRTGSSKPILDGENRGTAVADLLEGARYMVRTSWFFATLLFANGYVLVVIGPIEVLVPFILRDLGGGPGTQAMVLAIFGIAGAVGAITVSSLFLARRYLTVMLAMWGLGSLPLIVVGQTHSIWIIVASSVVVGATGQAAQVIWGTLLQRRMPPEMLGRASSLNFFVGLVMMPASYALAVPAAQLMGVAGVFVIAAVTPAVLSVIVHVAARLGRDEIAHSLQ
ncbi:MFS transporter [Mycobacterium montefiorense]|uniref:MFS transporter n=1 Tax=Mycobacterium montefiorense TaxID=154654 RepID=UPI000D598038